MRILVYNYSLDKNITLFGIFENQWTSIAGSLWNGTAMSANVLEHLL